MTHARSASCRSAMRRDSSACRSGKPPGCCTHGRMNHERGQQRASCGTGSPLQSPLRCDSAAIPGASAPRLAARSACPVCIPAHEVRLAARLDGRWRNPAPTPFRSPLLAARLTLPDGGIVVLLPTYSHGTTRAHLPTPARPYAGVLHSVTAGTAGTTALRA